MLTQEEIRIKAGLDYSRVTAGLNSIRGQVNKLAADVPKKLTSLLKANLYASAAGIIAEILPTWQEIWDKVYGVDAEADKRLEESGKKLKNLRKSLKDSQDEITDIWKKSQMEGASPIGKAEMLKGDLATAKDITKTALENLKFAKDHKMSIEKVTEAQIKYNQALAAQWKAEEALKAQVGKLTPAELQAMAQGQLDSTRGQVFKDRIDIKSLQDELALDPNNPQLQKQLADAQGRVLGVASAREMTMRGGYGDKLKDAGSALGNLPFMGGAADLFKNAQKQALTEVVQRVKIVEVE